MSELEAISAIGELGAIVYFAKHRIAKTVDFRPVYDLVTRDTLVHLSHLPTVQEVNLDKAPVGDESVDYLLKLPKLSTLDLRRTQITDEGLERLKQAQSLKLLLVSGSQCTLEGVRRVRKSMIQTRIVFK